MQSCSSRSPWLKIVELFVCVAVSSSLSTIPSKIIAGQLSLQQFWSLIMAAGPAGVGDNLLPLGTSIWLTIGFMGSSLVIIIMSAYMVQQTSQQATLAAVIKCSLAAPIVNHPFNNQVAHRKTPFVRRKSWPLFLASSAGIVSVYISQTVYCWVYWQAVRGSGAIWWTGQVCVSVCVRVSHACCFLPALLFTDVACTHAVVIG